MQLMMECLPCLIRQAVDAAMRAGLTQERRTALMQAIFAELSQRNFSDSPPAMSGWINRKLREFTNVADPYRTQKNLHNALAAELLPELRQDIARSPDPFYRALRLAISGNIIDLGAKSGLTDEEIHRSLQQTMSAPFVNLRSDLKQAAERAERILYLTDNAGEIFFDRLLLEQLPKAKVTVAVRGHPVLNDATMEDAHAAGLHELAELTDNGSDAPGTILEECSADFRALYKDADLIIAKGQGNYESLSHRRENLYFLFMAKCPVVAGQLRVAPGTHLVSGPALEPQAVRESVTC